MSASKSTELKYVVISGSPAATLRSGRRLGEKITAGSIIALVGELGSGKTLFTRGLCAGLGVPENEVNSPTFAFVNEYRGRLPVYHVDLYRIDDIESGFEIGMLDYLSQAETGVIVLEWAEKMQAFLPEDYLQVKFEVISAQKRSLEFTASGEKSGALIRGFSS